MPRRRTRASSLLAVALGGAFLAHAALLAIEDATHQPLTRLGLQPVALPAPGAADATTPGAPPVAVVPLTAVDVAAIPLLPLPGPGDAMSFAAAHPLPGASAELPGATAASRGGGASTGGPATWTGRDDPDQTALRAQPWSSDAAYRAPRADLDRRAASPEAITRTPDAHYGDRTPRRVARAGDPDASRGDAVDGTGAGVGDATWRDADPVFDAAAGRTAPARRDGATRAADDGPLADRGDAAVDVTRKGAAGDDVAVAASSDQRHPDPFELTPARAGGRAEGEGVRGDRAGDGALPDGRGAGTGATRADVERGSGGAPVTATRSDPYLRELLRRLDDEITFPHDLKLDLRSGRVIAILTVHADGRIADVSITTSSGYDGFDAELARALRALRSLGKVPSALLQGRPSLRVLVPYTFRNPMIR